MPAAVMRIRERRQCGAKGVPRRADWRTKAGLGVRAQQSREVATCDAGACSGARSFDGWRQNFGLALFDRPKHQKIEQKCTKV
jgi:hypothetical protein